MVYDLIQLWVLSFPFPRLRDRKHTTCRIKNIIPAVTNDKRSYMYYKYRCHIYMTYIIIYIYIQCILYIYNICVSNCKFVQISLYYELLMTFLISLFYERFILFWFLCSLCPRMITSPPLPSLGGEPRPHFLPQNQKRSVYITCINIIATT